MPLFVKINNENDYFNNYKRLNAYTYNNILDISSYKLDKNQIEILQEIIIWTINNNKNYLISKLYINKNSENYIHDLCDILKITKEKITLFCCHYIVN